MSLNAFLSLQLNDYKEAEQSAKKSHTGIWKYGDVTEDMEEERLPVDKKIAK
jgi:endonuclease YncB( thermonuclease family)